MTEAGLSQAELAEKYIGLVWWVVRRCDRMNVDRIPEEDLVQEGFFGLLDAYATWDPSRGAFTTHAAWRIRGAVTHVLRPPKKRIKTVAGISDWTEDRRTGQPSANIVESERKNTIQSILKILPARHREIVRRHWGLGGNEPESFRAIAKSLGVSTSRVQQIHTEIMRRLAKWAKRTRKFRDSLTV